MEVEGLGQVTLIGETGCFAMAKRFIYRFQSN